MSQVPPPQAPAMCLRTRLTRSTAAGRASEPRSVTIERDRRRSHLASGSVLCRKEDFVGERGAPLFEGEERGTEKELLVEASILAACCTTGRSRWT
jgi:hypothetical protein